MRIRKQVYELTLDDLNRFPVWQFALDEEGVEDQDEATVRPFDYEGVLDPSEGGLIVRANFQLADGTFATGFLSPTPGETGLGYLQPIALGPKGQVLFWRGMLRPPPEMIADAYDILGKTAAQVFPIQFSTAVPLQGGPLVGEIPGFLVLEDFQTMRVSVLT